MDGQAAPIIVPRLLLAEVAGAIRRVTRDPIRTRLAVDTLGSMPHIRLIPLDDPLIDTAAEIAADYALRGADAIYVAVARQYNCTPVSLDREQRERAAAIATTRTPIKPPARAWSARWWSSRSGMEMLAPSQARRARTGRELGGSGGSTRMAF